jgi:hypothetical protein
MAACLSVVPVPPAVIDLVRKIEQVNKEGSDFYIDFEFVTLSREGEAAAERIPVEIAVLRLDGQIVVDTPIKYRQSIPELLAGVPRTGTSAKFAWSVMRSIYGQVEETWGRTWDEVRQILLDAGMNRNSYLVEWSNSGIDRRLLKMIMEKHTPSNSILLIPYWKTILPGFLSMSLSYFHPFICPDSKLYKGAHQAGFDTFMLIDGMRTMIDLVHRDDTPVEDWVANELRTDEQILQSQEQLKKQYDDDNDDDDDDQTWEDIETLNIQVAEKEAMEAMTDEEKELVNIFQKSLGTLPSVDETSNSTSMPSGMLRYDTINKANDCCEVLLRGDENHEVESEIDDKEDV